MGCCNSTESPQVAASPNNAVKSSRTSLSTKDLIPLIPSKNYNNTSDYRGALLSSYEKITAGVKSIYSPTNVVPILCLTLDAFPIVCTLIKFDESPQTCSINVPVVAASFGEVGKAICFSQFTFFSNEAFRTANTVNLIINCLNWVASGVMSSPAVIVYSDQYDEINAAFKEIGFSCTKCHKIELTNFSNYRVFVITSDMVIDDPDFITQITMNGCGLFVIYNEKSKNLQINALLENYGLAYANFAINEKDNCNLNPNHNQSEGLNEVPTLSVQQHFSMVKDANFVSVYIKLISLLLQNKVDLSLLDDTVTNIRYYIPVCDVMQSLQLQEIVNKSFDFLEKTNYHNNEGICKTDEQKILVILLQQIFQKLPVQCLPDIKCDDLFPGPTNENRFVNGIDISLEIEQFQWKSMGLYLPPHKIANLHINEEIEGVYIQIGSFTESLHTCNGVWKRWPIPCVTYPIIQNNTQIGTPYGGILYICSTSEEVKKITFKIVGCCYYPFYVFNQPKVYETTKDYKVPLSEIETSNIIFTLPTSNFLAISNNFSKICEKMTLFFSIISQVLIFKKFFQARVVFDIQLPNDQPICGYPIVENVEKIEKILIDGLNKPNSEIFTILTLISLLMIKENVFDKEKEYLLAQFAAAKALKDAFSDFNPIELEILDKKPFFKELWCADQKHKNIVSNSLKKVYEQRKNSNQYENNWLELITIFSNSTNTNFYPAFDIKEEVPSSIKSYQVFVC